jgi:hypothetical protein
MALSITIPNGRTSARSAADQDIILDYDPTTYEVTVTPEDLKKDETICFKGKNGTTVRVVFLSPFGDEILVMTDSETRTLTVGGFYHFKCFFTPPGGKEIQATTGGVIDVQPHRP